MNSFVLFQIGDVWGWVQKVRTKFQYHNESRCNVPASRNLPNVSAKLGGGLYSLPALGLPKQADPPPSVSPVIGQLVPTIYWEDVK